MRLFVPKIYQKDIFSINYQKLKEQGIKLLIFDLDNTIGSIKENYIKDREKELLSSLKEDFILVVASNSKKERVSRFLENSNIEYFSFSLKPTLKVLFKLKKKYNIAYQDMAIIGDQIMTDIFMGNRLNLTTILVDPIINIDFKITSLNRKLEKIMMKKNKIIRGSYYEK